MSDEAKWYVVHTYSGYENKVASNLEKTVENHSLQNLIFEIRVPTEKVTEVVERLGVETRNVEVSYNVGDSVQITDGPLEGFIGTVEEIDVDKNHIRVMVSMFGRETPVDLELDQAEPVE